MDYRSRSRPPPRGEYSPRNERDDYFQPTFDRNHRSRSLDYRRDFSDEEDFERERERERFRASQPHLGRAAFEYGREREIDSPRRERDYFQTIKRGADGRREIARSQEWYPSPRGGERAPERWQPPSPNELRYKWRGQSREGRAEARADGRPEYGLQRQQFPRHPPNLSPVSQASAPRPLKIQTTRQPQQKGFFGQRREQPDESPKSIGYPPPRDREAPRYRYDGRMELQPAIGGAQSGGYSRSYQQSYHQSHQSGGGGFSSSGRRAITAQPGQQAGSQSWKYQGNTGQGPRQYHRVHCGCFSFTWPPWSVQPAPPPQPRYPNIP